MSAKTEYRLCVLLDGELRAAAKLWRQAIDLGRQEQPDPEAEGRAVKDAAQATYQALYHLIMADDPQAMVLVVGHVPSPAEPQGEGR